MYCMKIYVILFKNWEYEFKIVYQTGPLLLASHVHIVIKLLARPVK